MNTAIKEREATNNYTVRKLTSRQKWALHVLLDNGTEDMLGRYDSAAGAVLTGRMLAGHAGKVFRRSALP